MVDKGLIRQSSPGIFHYLPLGLRIVNKLTRLIDRHMECLGAQKIQMSCLTEGSLWKKTGKY